MSEFKFSCSACGQNILCDTAHVGTEIACPVCDATIVVPEETAGSGDVSAQADVPPALPGDTATTAQRTSRLAIASLVCSLSSLITCVGWLPGIICGHLAKSRIRRNPSLKGSGLATAGLVIGYLLIMLQVGAAAVWIWSFTVAVKHGFENVRQDLATNNLLVTQTQSTTVSNGDQQVEPVKPETVVPDSQPAEPVKSEPVKPASKPELPAPASPIPTSEATVSDLTVRLAEYGMGVHVADVTARVTELLHNRPNGFVANAKTLGTDPLPGKKKRLTIHYDYKGSAYTLTIQSGKKMSFHSLVNNAFK